jgi:RND family efflux transporter MFP subunit
VTVALPVRAPVAEYSEHTGRTEAPGVVELRARVAGHLVRAPFREGDPVRKGDLLFVVDPRPFQAAVERARAELASIRADRALAARNEARAEQLVKAAAISERDFDQQKSALEQLAARQAVASAALASAELDLAYASVRAPIAGRIGRKLVTEGNLVGPSTPMPLATLVSVDPLYVYIDVDEARGLALSHDKSAQAKVGFAGEEGYPHSARVDFVDNRVDATTGTLRVRAIVANAEGRLRHGLFARVRLTSGAPTPALLISDRAVATDQDRRFVWVVGSDDKVQYRPVTLGQLDGALRVVRAGLRPDDRVLVRGLQRVRPGAEVAAALIPMQEVDR